MGMMWISKAVMWSEGWQLRKPQQTLKNTNETQAMRRAISHHMKAIFLRFVLT
jgi:hypothetical protein